MGTVNYMKVHSAANHRWTEWSLQFVTYQDGDCTTVNKNGDLVNWTKEAVFPWFGEEVYGDRGVDAKRHSVAQLMSSGHEAG